ncbi:phage virion morphogenesis protein [[Haemophilus] felis]|uniref:Phage virion morphogenesis protein n=1 Tax=[Haemophilus] felis TaxID=123822 RepID=A0A1T0AVZ4_9PAST|nr:phage virion morphogenesis protein [[Haemophilus] felis]NBI41470.1 phage virion morphogenesis protein [[Haemophilus] felis]OOS01121.1 phage virion morphogenesis protein [[Haemophilus] felis]
MEAKFTALLANLSPKALKQLKRNIGRKLAQSQRQRIAKQQNPDGTPFAPRKPQKRGRIKRKGMFVKLRRAKFLKTNTKGEQLSVGFWGSDAHIASVHQYGLKSRVHRKRNYKAQYAKRELLGFTEQDKEMIEALIIQQLSV